MRIFLDTNVVVAAFATRGLCADLLRYVISEHELVVGEVVIRGTRRALRDKVKLSAKLVAAIEEYLRGYEVIAKPRRSLALGLRDPSDEWILASAVQGSADIVVSGDRDLLDVARNLPVRTVSPRECWDLIRRGRL